MLNQANKAVLDALVALHANMLAQDLGNQAERPTEEEFQACMAAASAAIRAATEEGAPAPADPMDWPLPCDVVIGHITMRKGLKLSALVKPMQVLYEMTEGASLAAQAAPAAVAVPIGWKLVPTELTEEMRREAFPAASGKLGAQAAYRAMLAAAPQPQAPAAQGDAVLAYLDGLSDDAAAHIFPDDLRRCSTSECTATVYSVRVGSPDGKTVPLYSREQVAAAIAAQKGRAA